jgi:ABC-2 type transport system permease protein
MSNTIGGERYSQTLELLLASPARRAPLFLGRALPVIINGFGASVIALVVGGAALRVALPLDTWLPLAAVVAVSAFACTGLGLVTAAVSLRVRETAVLANIVFGVLLVFCGTHGALTASPDWMATIGLYVAIGMMLLRFFEAESRRRATLQIA